jgi:hypothetical protein
MLKFRDGYLHVVFKYLGNTISNYVEKYGTEKTEHF